MSGKRCLYYHATGSELPTGRLLRSRPSSRAGFFERWVDALRPKGMPSRVSSFFLGEDPADLLALGAQSIRHVYNVEPFGVHFKGDGAWLPRAMDVWDEIDKTDGLGPESSKLVRSYWSGRRSPWFQGWEIVAPTIRICGKLDEKQRQRIVDAADLKNPGFLDRRIMGRMIASSFGPNARTDLTSEVVARELGIENYPTERRRQRQARR